MGGESDSDRTSNPASMRVRSMAGSSGAEWTKVTREVRSEMEMDEAGRERGGEVKRDWTLDTHEGQCRLPGVTV